MLQYKAGIKMSKLISFDFAIKYLLKDKSNYSIIEGFISAILKEQGYKPVKIIALLDTESNREEYSSKKSWLNCVSSVYWSPVELGLYWFCIITKFAEYEGI